MRSPPTQCANMPRHSHCQPSLLHSPCFPSRQIVRTASFSRRSKENRSNENDTEADNSSESRSPTPDSPEDDALGVATVMTDRLYGWLKKKSQGKGRWSRRYFFVDETRGTLGYAKSHTGRGSKPSAVLPIADITKIETVPGEPNTFVISCPPIHLTVAAVSVKERKNWVRQLELRAEVWRARQAEKMPVASAHALLAMSTGDSPVEKSAEPSFAAVPSAAARATATDSARSAASQGRGASATTEWEMPSTKSPPHEVRPPSPPAHAEHLPAMASPEESLQRVASAVLEPRPVVPCRNAPAPASAAIDLSEPTDEELAEAARQLDAEAREQADNEAKWAAAPAKPVVKEQEQESSATSPGIRQRASSRRQAAEPPRAMPRTPDDAGGNSVVETVELYSGDEDDEDDADVHSANKASGGARGADRNSNASPPMRCPAPVPLAAMISSDEEESDEERSSRAPAAMRRGGNIGAPQPAHAPEESDDEDEDELDTKPRRRITGSFSPEERAASAHAPMAAPAAKAAHAPKQPALPPAPAAPLDADDNWDSSDSEDEDDGIPALDQQQHHRRPAHETAPTPAPIRPSANSLGRGPAPEPEPALMAAPGIVADEGFAEEDWDDDE